MKTTFILSKEMGLQFNLADLAHALEIECSLDSMSSVECVESFESQMDA